MARWFDDRETRSFYRMRIEVIGLLTSLLATVTLAGCGRMPPPATPPPVPSSSPSPIAVSEPTQAQPPSKCESLEEGCIAADNTRTAVGRSGWTIALPRGWTFARDAHATIAANLGATIAVTTYDRSNRSRSRDAVLRRIAEGLGIDVAGRETLLPKRPHKRQPVGDVVVSLYELGRTRRSQQEGVLVVFTTDLPSDAAVLGVAFVTEHDKTTAGPQIVRAIESLDPPVAPGSSLEPPPVVKARLSSDVPDEPNYGLDLHTLH